jgi:serine/threonine protein phosphatase PrpC
MFLCLLQNVRAIKSEHKPKERERERDAENTQKLVNVLGRIGLVSRSLGQDPGVTEILIFP